MGVSVSGNNMYATGYAQIGDQGIAGMADNYHSQTNCYPLDPGTNYTIELEIRSHQDYSGSSYLIETRQISFTTTGSSPTTTTTTTIATLTGSHNLVEKRCEYLESGSTLFTYNYYLTVTNTSSLSGYFYHGHQNNGGGSWYGSLPGGLRKQLLQPGESYTVRMETNEGETSLQVRWGWLEYETGLQDIGVWNYSQVFNMSGCDDTESPTLISASVPQTSFDVTDGTAFIPFDLSYNISDNTGLKSVQVYLRGGANTWLEGQEPNNVVASCGDYSGIAFLGGPYISNTGSCQLNVSANWNQSNPAGTYYITIYATDYFNNEITFTPGINIEVIDNR
tara:strand:- start:89 stop:1096 length:1008 start_codon:yes stop_codon:yes gene_type:complete